MIEPVFGGPADIGSTGAEQVLERRYEQPSLELPSDVLANSPEQEEDLTTAIPMGAYGELGLNFPVFPYGRIGRTWKPSETALWLMDVAVQGSALPQYVSVAAGSRRVWDRWTLGPEIVGGYCAWKNNGVYGLFGVRATRHFGSTKQGFLSLSWYPFVAFREGVMLAVIMPSRDGSIPPILMVSVGLGCTF